MATAEKSPDALKTIGELSHELGVAQHILRYWETKFPQLRPMQRAGNRRYYRPADVALVRRINRLLNEEGYTVRGVQKLLRDKNGPVEATVPQSPVETVAPLDLGLPDIVPAREERYGVDLSRLVALRDRLADALQH